MGPKGTPAPLPPRPYRPEPPGNPYAIFPGNAPKPNIPEPKPKDSKRASTSIIIAANGNPVYCRNYPDTISPGRPNLPVYNVSTTLSATCWSEPSLPGNSGRVDGEATWLQTDSGCYVNSAEVQQRQNFKDILNQCNGMPKHWVGISKSEYTRLDCYDCASLDCPSQNVGEPPYVDLDCFQDGEDVRGNKTWFRNKDVGCFLPAEVFNANAYFGTPGDRC